MVRISMQKKGAGWDIGYELHTHTYTHTLGKMTRNSQKKVNAPSERMLGHIRVRSSFSFHSGC